MASELKQYKRNNVTYTVIDVRNDERATYYLLQADNGETVWVGRKVLKEKYKEIK